MAENGNGWMFVEVGVLVPAILSAALPSPFTMRTFAHDPESVTTLRIGEYVGGSMVVLLGIAESMQHKSWMPLVLVLVVGGAWFGYIEWALRNPIQGGKDMAGPANAPMVNPVTAGQARVA